MTEPTSMADLRQQEYAQRQTVTSLRRQIYQHADPRAAGALWDALQAAEAQLVQLEQERARRQAADPASGRLLHAGGAAGRAAFTLGAETTGLQTTVHLRLAQVPTAYSHLLDVAEHPLLTCTVENADDQTRRVRVTAYIEAYSARAVASFEIPGGQSHTFNLLPHLFRHTVADLNEATRAMLNLLVEDLDTGKVEIHRTYPIWLLARTSGALLVSDPQTGEWQDMTRYLGAFVTPNAPVIMSFLRQAVEYHHERRFVGYQSSPEAVEPQVKALYDALKQLPDIRYVNSVIQFTPEDGAIHQRVRLPRESLTDKQANCIDGTVLLASLLEAISLSPAIVIVPGHAFLAWETWRQGNEYSDEWRYLETTMIGTHTFEQACASADSLAKRMRALAANFNDPNRFRRWPLRQLRVEYDILPME
ncbi:MAG: hypothetical protein R3300_17745 [Candidatus Promineifilaceae bacterium]|nr:hypothetical protein [Candidatus Promineifilaceae bacterium]